MTDHGGVDLSWVCPACDRRVPARVAGCRCGDVRPRADAGQPGAGGAARATASPFRLASYVAAGLIVGAAAVWVLNRPRSAPVESPPLSSARPAPSVAAVERPVPTPSPAPDTPEPSPSAAPDAPEPKPAPAAEPPKFTLEDVIGRAMPAVVRVEAGGAFGTGFFVAPDTILTNVHVVSGNITATIRRPDGTTRLARVDLSAPDVDIAVLRVSTPDANQPTLPLGSGMTARPGEEVIALGTPLGLQNTVTRGIVSAVRRVGAVTLVQTDAAINPGNSGGPLLDRSGTVIGIATMGMRSAQGLSFAVAIDHARALLEGTRRVESAGTPLSNLNEAMRGDQGGPPSDRARNAAAEALDQALAELGRRADALDDRWRSFVRGCYEGRVAGAFDREWFALYDRRAMQGAVAYGCAPSFESLRQLANDIRNGVAAADEAARRADVYPGTRRDLRRKYRLDYAGWDR